MTVTNLHPSTSTQTRGLNVPNVAVLTGVAIALIIVVGFIHFVEAPDNLTEATYKGVLFILNGVAALVAAVGIYRQQAWGWWLGCAVAGGALVMYVVSRTIGLPIVGVDDAWFEPIGVLSLLTEAGFVAVFAWTQLFNPNKN